MFGSVHTDSMLALADTDGNRRVRLGVEAAIVDLATPDGVSRRPIARNLAVNTSLVHPRTAIPALAGALGAGDHTLGCLVHAAPTSTRPKPHKFGVDLAPSARLAQNFGLDLGQGVDIAAMVVPTAVLELLDRIAEQEMS